MSLLVVPNTFTNNTIADADQVNANFDAIEAVVNDLDAANLDVSAKPITLLGPYRSVLQASGYIPQSVASGLRIFINASATLANGGSTNAGPILDSFAAADFAVSGLTPKLRVRAHTLSNATAAGVTFTFGLHNITALGGGSGGLTTYTYNTTAEAGSTAAIVPVAGQLNSGVSTAFAVPSGNFGLCVTLSGTTHANSGTACNCWLQVHWE